MAEQRATLEAAEVAARRIGAQIKAGVPAGWGFVLLLSSHGREGFSTWVTTYERLTAVRVLEEFLQTMAGTLGDDRTTPQCWLCDTKAQPLITMRGPNRSVVLCAHCILLNENREGEPA